MANSLCPECDEPLSVEVDVREMERSGAERYDIVCNNCGYEREAEFPDDQELIDAAAERSWEQHHRS